MKMKYVRNSGLKAKKARNENERKGVSGEEDESWRLMKIYQYQWKLKMKKMKWKWREISKRNINEMTYERLVFFNDEENEVMKEEGT